MTADTATRHLTWTQAGPTIWQRDLDEVEEFYASMAWLYQNSGRTFFGITGHISVTLPAKFENRLETIFKNAWSRLRSAHPTIASYTDPVPARKKFVKKYEVAASNGDLTQWANKTLLCTQTHLSGLDWCDTDPPCPKLPTLFVVRSADPSPADTVKRTVVLRAQHDIVDGMGTFALLNTLMKFVGEELDGVPPADLPELGSEVHRLSPPLRIAASLPEILNDEQKARLEEIKSQNQKLRQEADLLTIPWKSDAQIPGRHQRAVLVLSSDQTRSILQSCKARSITVTHAYHAAIALALRDIRSQESESPRSTRYITYCLVNERKTCAAPYNSNEHPATLYHSVSGEHLAIDLQIPVKKDEFFIAVEKMKDYYSNQRNNDPNRLALIPACWRAGIPTFDLSTPGDQLPIPPPNPTPSASVSSFGRINDVVSSHHGKDLVVDDPWVTGEELGNGLGLFLGTWNGQLHISAAFNEAFQDKTGVERFLAQVHEVVSENLLQSKAA